MAKKNESQPWDPPLALQRHYRLARTVEPYEISADAPPPSLSIPKEDETRATAWRAMHDARIRIQETLTMARTAQRSPEPANGTRRTLRNSEGVPQDFSTFELVDGTVPWPRSSKVSEPRLLAELESIRRRFFSQVISIHANYRNWKRRHDLIGESCLILHQLH
jgi:hypothetical protein